jgi:hypothetical protein
MLSNLPSLVKKVLGHLPDNDYPKLTTRLFVSIWLNYVLDPGIESMRGLFQQLNLQGIEIDISTFSKASNHRDPKILEKIVEKLNRELNRKNPEKALGFFLCRFDNSYSNQQAFMDSRNPSIKIIRRARLTDLGSWRSSP